jgi:AMP deaminase
VNISSNANRSPGALSQGQDSESSSPRLGSARQMHLNDGSEEEDFRQERDNSEAGSEESWDIKGDGDSAMLPQAALMPDGTPDLSNPSESQDGMLPRDVQKRTAYYDYAAEKQLSQADAKLFYQRSQLEAQKTGGSNWGNSQTSPHGSPIMIPRNLSNVFESDNLGMRRSGSVNSMMSGHRMTQRYVKLDILYIRARAEGASSGRYKPTLPVGFADTEKHPESNAIQEPTDVFMNSPMSFHRRESLLRADQAARDHAAHPDLPHEQKPLLETEGLHGAGAGIGLGTGVGGFADKDANITSELSTIYTNIQKVLDIRHKYMRLSLQEDGDNPKDDPNWNIYPPPPEPAWYEEKDSVNLNSSNSFPSQTNSMANSMVLPQERPPTRAADHARNLSFSTNQAPQSPRMSKVSRPKRKPGQDIGEDFYLEDLLPVPGPGEMEFRLDGNGVYQVYENSKAKELDTPVINIPTIREFYMDLEEVLNVSSDGPSKSFAFRRLQYLEGKFNLYVLLNEYQEMADSKRVPHRDFYNVRKVDTHVHHSACMNQKHLLRFIKSKMKKFPDEVVMFRDGKHLTLEEVFQSINLTAYDLSIDTLDMHVRSLISQVVLQQLINIRHTPIRFTDLTSSILNTTQLENPDSEPFSLRLITSSMAGIWLRSRKRLSLIWSRASTKWSNGEYLFMAELLMSGTNLQPGLSITSYSLIMCDGSFRFLDYSTSTNLVE